MNDLYYTKSCKLWCFEDKRYIWIKIYIIIGYWALSTLSTQYAVYIRQLFDKQQLKQSWVDITKNAKNSRLKAVIGLFVKKCNWSPN